MANNNKKYVSLTRLSTFLDNIKARYALIGHKHTTKDITDYVVDSSLSPTSTNPVQNKVLNAEFDAISQAMQVLDAAIDDKADSTHDHNSVYYQKNEIDQKLSNKSDKTHNHDSVYSAIDHNHDGVYSLAGHNHDAKYESKGTASSAVSTHNTSTTSHADIRDLITGLTTRLNTLANSDDTTLDQMSEVVTYIKNNKSLIDGITTNKVNVSDIINNLTTNVSNKPLSAAQGVELKRLIDTLQSSLQSSLDAHDANTTKHITSTERTNWNTAKTLAENAVKKTGDTMSGSLTVQMDTDTAPQLTLKGEANSSGQRTSTIIRKYAFANSDYGTEIEDKTFNGSYVRLGLNTTATTPAEKIILKNRTYSSDGSYSDKTYKLYGEHNKPTPSDIGLTATATELNYVDGVTSNIQAQIDSKLDANAITGAASTIVSDDLTTNRVLISDNYGKVSASNISGGELSRLSGATKNIQEQIDDLDEAVDNKVSKYGDTMTGSLAIEPTSTTSPLISLIGNANASGQQAKSRFRKGTNSSIDNGTEVVDETFDGRKTSLILQSNKDLDKNRLRLKLTASDGTYEEYNLYGEHYKPTAADLGALENSSYDLYSFVTDRNVMYASNIVSDDVIPFVDVSLRSGRKITMTEFLKYISNNSGLASVAPVSTAEYTALENTGKINANTLYMLTDAEEEIPTQVQIVTWGDDD